MLKHANHMRLTAMKVGISKTKMLLEDIDQTDISRPSIEEITVIELPLADYVIVVGEINLASKTLRQWADPLIVHKLEGEQLFYWRNAFYDNLSVLMPRLFPNDQHSAAMFKLKFG